MLSWVQCKPENSGNEIALTSTDNIQILDVEKEMTKEEEAYSFNLKEILETANNSEENLMTTVIK